MSAIGLSLLLGGCAAGAGGSRPVLGLDGQTLDASDPVERGRALILTGQYGLAIDGLNEVVTRDRGNARAFSLLAVAYAQLKRFDLADRYHAQALEIDPGSVVALNNWGYSYLVRGDGNRAAGLLERAAATNDHRPIVTANLALARGDDAEKPPTDELAGGGDPMRSIQLSPHVILVRPAARLRRVAPGVQMLLTIDPAETPRPALLSLVPVAPPPSGRDGVTQSAVTTEQRLFQALFDLIEDPQPLAAVALGLPRQVADMSLLAPRPLFGTAVDIDDFTRL
jgi:tetratricopeptide (TPR) repeat protein